MLTAEQTRKLERLQNCATRYEAVVIRQDGEKRLVAYSGRKSRAGLLSAVQQRGQAVIAFLGLSDSDQMTWRNGEFALGTGHAIRWSGRTQRDAIMQGELTYIEA